MNTRRIATRFATFAALAVASFSGAMAHAGGFGYNFGYNPGYSSAPFVVVFGGQAFTFSMTGVTHSGGAG
jgi:hypothetical protein